MTDEIVEKITVEKSKIIDHMKNLKTSYLGLELNSPLIVGSSGISKKATNLKKAEESGAGAIVLKSIFEEQIEFETNQTIKQSIDYPEAFDYIRNYSKHNSINQYIELIQLAKKTVAIPIIASINCTTNHEWCDLASKIEAAGADALELNLNIPQFNPDESSAEVDEKYFKIIENIKANTKLNIACKISNYHTNLPYFVKQLNNRGINSFVLFNRFFEPLIDINKQEITSAPIFSTASELKNSLRWVAIIKGLIPNIEISASTGIHSANEVIQQLLAGADTVQICSALYKKGVDELGTIKLELENWMEQNSYENIPDFRGKLSYDKVSDPKVFERFQFIKHFAHIE